MEITNMDDVWQTLFKVLAVVTLGFLGIAVADKLSDNSDSSERSFKRLDGSSAMIWTTEPARVFPERQNFQRIPSPPDPFPLKLRIMNDRFVLSNNSFRVGDTVYRLRDVDAIERSRVCSDEEGRRFSCGLLRFKNFQKAIRRKLMECGVVALEMDAKVVECQINGTLLKD